MLVLYSFKKGSVSFFQTINYSVFSSICVVVFLLFFFSGHSSNAPIIKTKPLNSFVDVAVPKGGMLEAAIKKESNIQTYHLVSHGRSGELFINGKWLNAKGIVGFLKSRLGIEQSGYLYLNIYGCEFAKGEKGAQVVMYLEKILGIKVAASTNITGKDGDWVLEYGASKEVVNIPLYKSNLQVANTGLDDDFDGDNILNRDDLDDDNDGILDAVESPECFYTKEEAALITSVTSGIPARTASETIDNIIDGNTSSYAAFTDNAASVGDAFFTVTPTAPLAIDALEYFSRSWPLTSGSSRFKLQGFDGVNWVDLSPDLIRTGTGSIQTIPNTLQPNEVYSMYQIILSVGNNDLGGISEVKLIPSDSYQASLNPKASCTNDLDNDGVYNHLDLDSDGDGCPDAAEAGVTETLQDGDVVNGDGTTNTTTSTANAILDPDGADVNNDGLNDSVDANQDHLPDYASTYEYYTIDATRNFCIDLDGDGVPDLTDIDDDNDGVLDAVESPDCFYNKDEAAIITEVTTDIALTSGNTIEATIDGMSNTSAFYVDGSGNVGDAFFTVTPTVPIAIDALKYNPASNTLTRTTSRSKLQGFNGHTWVDLSPDLDGGSASSIQTIPNTLQPGVVFSRYQLVISVGTNSFGGVGEIELVPSDNYRNSEHPKPSCTDDFDNDGVYNHQDLDSDGDGCPDTTESSILPSNNDDLQDALVTNGNGTDASANQESNQVNAQLNPEGDDTNNDGLNDSIDANQDGVPDNQSTYLINAVDRFQGLCVDTDEDGVPDVIDIDDDNDGVLDTDEGFSCVDFDMGADGTFESLSSVALDGGTGQNQFNGNVTDGGWQNASLSADSWQAMVNTQGESSNSGLYVGLADGMSASPQGGVFAAALKGESFETTVNNLMVGVTYRLSFYQANAGNDGTTETGSESRWSVTFGGDGQFSDFIAYRGEENQVWEKQVLFFTATATSQVLNFLATDAGLPSNHTYMAIDGIQIDYATQDNCALDTDNDGVPDYLDLDSDGDGCPDAVEAAVPLNNGDLQTADIENGDGTTNSMTSKDNAILNPNGVDANNDGLNDSVDADQDGMTDYTSTYITAALDSAVNDCPEEDIDTDGDMIPDNVDIDDDNDGILDVEEGLIHDNFLTNTTTYCSGGDAYPSSVNQNFTTVASNQDHQNKGLRQTYNFSPPITNIRFITWSLRPDSSYGDFTINYIDNTSDVNADFTIIDSSEYTAAEVQMLSTAGAPNISEDIVKRTKSTGEIVFTTLPNSVSGQGAGVLTFDTMGKKISSISFRNLSETTVSGGATTLFEIFGTIEPCNDDEDDIPNHLDLDSDGDGCPDAVEAGVPGTLENGDVENGDGTNNTTTATDNAVASDPYGANGLANSLENGNDTTAATTSYDSTYTNYALNAGINACTDADNDMIPDAVDLDDDNDGILDVDENCVATSEAIHNGTTPFDSDETSTGTTVTVSTQQVNANVGIIGNYNPPRSFVINGQQRVEYTSTVQINPDATSNETIITYTFSNPILASEVGIMIEDIDRGLPTGSISVSGGTATTADFSVQSVLRNGESGESPEINYNSTTGGIDFPSAPSSTNRYASLISGQGSNTLAELTLTISNLGNGGSSGDNVRIYLVPIANCDNDFDGDGIPNSLDLDSDADGCPDAVEGDGSFTAADNDLVTDTNIAGGSSNVQQNLGNSSNDDGTPNIEGTSTTDNETQGLGDAHFFGNDTICCTDAGNYDAISDRDNDNIGDSCDLDDDNDGILDTVECPVDLGESDFMNNWDNPTGTWMFSNGGANAFVVIGNEPAPLTFTQDGLTGLTEVEFTVSVRGGDLNNDPNSGSTMNMFFTINGVNYVEWQNTTATAASFPIPGNLVTSNGATISPSTFEVNLPADGPTEYTITIPWDATQDQAVLEFRTDGSGEDDFAVRDFSFSRETTLHFCTDPDGDGVKNNLDLDSDNDGISDIYEAGNPTVIGYETNGNSSLEVGDGFVDDGTLPNATANNGLDDRIESLMGAVGTGVTPVDSFDTAGDTIPDWLDLDSDDDGIPDTTEARATEDYIAYPATIDDTADSDNDGVLDIYDDTPGFGSTRTGFITGTRLPNADADDTADTLPDYIDTDADGDGLTDTEESNAPAITGISYVNPDGNINDPLSDNDGSIRMQNSDFDATDVDFRSLDVDECDAVASGNRDTDGDGISDSCDLDDDNDGILDTVECPNDLGEGNFNNWDNPTLNWTLSASGALIRNVVDDVVSPITFTQDGFEGLTQLEFTFSVRGSNRSNSPLTTSFNDLFFTINGVDYVEWENTTATAPSFPIPGNINISNGAQISPTTFEVNSTGFNEYTVVIPWDTTEDEAVIEFRQGPGGQDDFIVNDFSFSRETSLHLCVDTDGDNILNHLDLDSDNDGCSDLSESDPSQDDGDIATVSEPYGVNGFADSLEDAPDSAIATNQVNTDDGSLYSNAIDKTVLACFVFELEDDTATVDEDAPITIGIQDNDTDVPDNATISIDQDPTNGSVVLNPDGTVTYTPDENFNGTDTFTYEVCDMAETQTCEIATVTVTVTPINDAPIAAQESVSIQEDMGVDISILSNDTDVDGNIDPSTVAFSSIPSGSTQSGDTLSVPGEGVWTIDPMTGVLNFTPEENYSGSVTPIGYTVKDDQGLVSNQAIVSVSITGVNDAPMTTDDSFTGAEDSPLVMDVLSNDTDIDGSLDPSSVSFVNPPAGSTLDGNELVVPGEGVWSIDPVTGAITFSPELNFNGSATPIEYTVLDDQGVVSPHGTVSVTISSENDAPIAAQESVSIQEDMGVDISILSNDTDVDGNIDPSTVAFSSIPSGSTQSGDTLSVPGEGVWTIDSMTGVLNFTPEENYAGSVTPIGYTVKDDQGLVSNQAIVSVSITGVNDAPMTTDDSFTGGEDSPLVMDVLSNDTDIDGSLDPSSVSFVNPPAGSTLDGNELVVPGEGVWSIDPVTGAITFSPELNFNGSATPIEYTVLDDQGVVSPHGTVSVTISSENDAPIAAQESVSIQEDMGVDISILSNDTDVDGNIDPSTVAFSSIPSGSTQSGDTLSVPGEGVWTIDPMTGVLNFTPEENYSGSVTPIGYTVKDDQGLASNQAIVSVSITGVNDAPMTTDDSFTGAEDSPLVMDVLSNDTDIDGSLDPSSVSFVNPPAGSTLDGNELVVPGEGVWSIDPVTGAITFSPELNFNGSATPIEYTVLDDQGVVSPHGTVSVTISSENDAPIAAQESVSIQEDMGVDISILSNDTDVDGNIDPSTVAFSSIPSGSTQSGDTLSVPGEGVWTIDPMTGVLSFTPEENYAGSVTPIGYTVKDDQGLVSNQAIVSVSITGVNDAPMTTDDSFTGAEDSPLVMDVLSNDTDIDGSLDPSSVSFVNPPAGSTLDGNELVVPGEGVWSIDPVTGAITFSPELNFNGSATPIEYTVLDDQGVVSPHGTVSVTISSENDAPIAAQESVSIQEDMGVDISILSNDTDVDGNIDPSTVAFSSIPSGSTQSGDTLSVPGEGVWTIDPMTGVLNFTPEENYSGSVTPIGYTVKDDQGLASNQAIVSVSITGVNDAPMTTDDSFTGAEDSPLVMDVLSNDTDIDGSLDPSSVSFVNPPAGSTLDGNELVVPGEGVWSIDPVTGAITFSPELNFNGSATPIEYTVLDDQGVVSPHGTVSVTISSENDAPIAAQESVSIQEDMGVDISILSNDTDVDGNIDPSTVAFSSIPSGSTQSGDTLSVPGEGVWTIDPMTGVLSFTPEENYAGSVTPIGYTVKDDQGLVSNQAIVSVSITGVNDAPMTTDDSFTGAEDSPLVMDVLSNDTDIDGSLDPSSVSFVNPPAGSTLDGNELVVPGEGVWSIDPVTGAITFSPELNFNGSATPIEYTVLDDQGVTSLPGVVMVSIISENDAPVAADNNATGDEDTALIVDVLSNDNDPENGLDPSSVLFNVPGTNIQSDTLTVPGEGVWSVDISTGEVIFNPDPNFFGAVSPVEYTVSDIEGLVSNPATVSVFITGVNDAIAINPDSGSGLEDSPVVLQVLNNDSSLDGHSLLASTITLVDPPVGAMVSDNGQTMIVPNEGVWTVNPVSGEVTFTPESNYNGEVTSISYTVADDNGSVSPTALLSIDIIPVNDSVMTANDSVSVQEDTAVTIAVLLNDSDVDSGIDPSSVVFVNPPMGTTLESNVLTVPGEGVWTIDPVTGEVIFTPEANFTGDSTPVSYTVSDTSGLESDSGLVTVTVLPINDAPEARDDLFTSLEDMPITIGVLDNDIDVEGELDPSSVAFVNVPAGSVLDGNILTVPGEGVWTIDSSTGAITFTPESNYTGELSPIEYTVSDQDGLVSLPVLVSGVVTSVNDSPLTANDSETGQEDMPISIGVLDNDKDDSGIDPSSVVFVNPPMGTTLESNVLTVPGEGVWTIDSVTGEVIFTPEANFTGDSTPVSYTVSDTSGLESDPGLVTVTVLPINDAPEARDDLFTSLEDMPITIGVLDNDIDVEGELDPSSVAFVNIPAGSVLDGNILTVPGEGVWTIDSSTGAITFTPESNYTGELSPIEYTVSDQDGLVSLPVLVSGVVTSVNDSPLTANDSETGQEDMPISIGVLDNDKDDSGIDPSSVVFVNPPMGTTLESNVLTVPGEGVWSIDPVTGEVIFTPEANFTGDSTPVSYTVSDTSGLESDPGLVTVTVLPINDAPEARDDLFTSLEDMPITIGVLDNDIDVEGELDPSSVAFVNIPAGSVLDGNILTVPGEGVWTIDSSTGAITFTPESNYTGELSPIEYTVSDQDGLVSLPVLVSGVVTSVNDSPLTADDSETGQEDMPISIGVLDNDKDDSGIDPSSVVFVNPPMGTTLESNVLTVPGEGVWTIDPVTGEVIFTPEANFTGDSTPVSYTVSDTSGLESDSGLVTVTVLPINDAPEARDDLFTSLEDMPITIGVLDNDTDVEGELDPSSVAFVNVPAGSVLDGNILTVPGEGVWTIDSSTGGITFTPESNYTGELSPIEYTVSDQDGLVSLPVLVSGVVTSVNDSPLTADDSETGQEDMPISIGVLDNDKDDSGIDPSSVLFVNPPMGTTLESNVLTVPGEGVWSIDSVTGEVIFTPEANFTGDSTPVSYTVSDTSGLESDPGLVTVTVLPINDAPVVENDMVVGIPGLPITIGVLDNDTDVEGELDPSSVAFVNVPAGSVLDGNILTVPGEGVWTIDSSTGGITFTPESDFFGTPNIVEYTVSDTDGLSSLPALVEIVVSGCITVPSLDCDLDGLTNAEELTLGTDLENPDSDGDGVTDGQELEDLTDPIDGCSFIYSNQTLTPNSDWDISQCDSDGDLIPDSLDLDDDNDGILDAVEGDIDSDGDLIPDYLDLDSDNDGVIDAIEGHDSNQDGIPDHVSSGTDSDNNGVDDAYDRSPASTPDTDSDGLPDYRDTDDDNDGILTIEENSNPDGVGSTTDAFDSNGNGLPDYLEVNASVPSGDLEVFNSVTPNGDGLNDVFTIGNIELFPNNTVKIYNRWGVLVYDVDGYGQNGKYFTGESNGRVTLIKEEQLPTGTYFYVLTYTNDTTGTTKEQAGYLYIQR